MKGHEMKGHESQVVIDSRRRLLRGGTSAMALVLASAGCLAGPAFAQNETGDEVSNLPAAAPGVAPGSAQEIVVTGSRIARPDDISNTPIVTVQKDMLKDTASFALDQKLLQLPQFAASANSQYNTSYFSNGAATLNLRNLGDNRNLVLLDGRRLQPSTSSFAIDINTIPSILIQSVDVITGGASAVYGSDAISGVVNFKLKHNFQGVELNAQYGIAQQGDDQETNIGLLVGGNFGDNRGNAVFALNYADRGAVYNRDRSFWQKAFASGRAVQSANTALSFYVPTGNLPSQQAVNAYFGQYGAQAGAVANTNSLGFNNDASSLFNFSGPGIYDYRGKLYPDDPRFTINDATPGVDKIMSNALYNSYLSIPLTRYSAFGRADYELTDDISVFAQGMFTHYSVLVGGTSPAASGSWDVLVPRDADHPVPAAFATLLDSRPDPSAPWALGQQLTFMGQQILKNETNLSQLLVGLKGDVPGTDWTWEAYGTHGQTQMISEAMSGFVNLARLRELMDAPNYGKGYSSPDGGTCTSGILPFGEKVSSLSGQNVQTNPSPTSFGGVSQAVSDDCINFIQANLKSVTELHQDVAEANLQGGLTDLPAGKLRFAVGVDYRRDSFDYNPDDALAPNANYRSNTVGQFGVSPVSGSTDAYEAYAELLVPVLKDLPLVRSLDADLAYRYSKYPSGGNSAYKIDLNWKVVGALRFRGGYERAVRAPNVLEEFSPPSFNVGLLSDPCEPSSGLPYGNVPGNPNRAAVQTLCRAIMGPNAPANLDNYVSGAGSPLLLSFPKGNPNLKPEKADTFTVGAVLRPSWDLPLNGHFSLSVDYYHIKIKGAIGYISAPLTYQLCFDANGKSNPTLDPNNAYCQTIRRSQVPADNFAATLVDNAYENQGGIKTDGIDVQGDFRFIAGPGHFDLNVLVNYLNSYKISVAIGAPYLEYANTTGGYFQWKTFTSAAYTIGGGTLGLRWRHLDAVKDSTTINDPNSTVPGTPAYNVFDLYGHYTLNKAIEFRGGIDNLFDTDPAVVGGIPGNTDSANYDVLGRRFYLGVDIKL